MCQMQLFAIGDKANWFKLNAQVGFVPCNMLKANNAMDQMYQFNALVEFVPNTILNTDNNH